MIFVILAVLKPVLRRVSLIFSQKLQERLSVFKKRTYEKQDEEKWMKVLIPEMVSSEESGEEDVNC